MQQYWNRRIATHRHYYALLQIAKPDSVFYEWECLREVRGRRVRPWNTMVRRRGQAKMNGAGRYDRAIVQGWSKYRNDWPPNWTGGIIRDNEWSARGCVRWYRGGGASVTSGPRVWERRSGADTVSGRDARSASPARHFGEQVNENLYIWRCWPDMHLINKTSYLLNIV